MKNKRNKEEKNRNGKKGWLRNTRRDRKAQLGMAWEGQGKAYCLALATDTRRVSGGVFNF